MMYIQLTNWHQTLDSIARSATNKKGRRKNRIRTARMKG